MNNNFINAVKASNKSIYRISKETGIPYTTINELYNEKLSINKVMVETVYKLAIYLEVDIKDILNYVSFLDGYSGTYKNFKFKWNQTTEGIGLFVKIDNKYKLIHTEKLVLMKENINVKKRIITEAILDVFEAKQKAEKELWELTI